MKNLFVHEEDEEENIILNIAIEVKHCQLKYILFIVSIKLDHIQKTS